MNSTRIGKNLLKMLPGYDPFSKSKGYRFDPQIARSNIDWIERELTFTQGEKAMKPFVMERWQKSLVANLMGWIDKNGNRRYRECLLYVPRKNGKSEFAAAIICLIMFTDKAQGTMGAQIYSAASTRDQTKFVFEPVKKMISNNGLLRSKAQIYRHSVIYKDRTYRALSSDGATGHGSSTHLGIIDELHSHKNREVVDQIVTSTGARSQPLIIYSTTADFERESICNKTYEYACRVRDGLVDDPTFLPVIYEASVDDDWRSEKVWKKSNPNYGVSISKEFFRKQAKRAQDDPSFENTFKRLHLNIKTEQANRWMPMDLWDDCETDFDHSILEGRECFGGLDLASTQDMAAFSLGFPMDEDFYILSWFWCPSELAEKKESRYNQPYVTWSRQGHLELTPGKSIDYRFIRRRINDVAALYKIREIAYDPWNAIMLAKQLEEEDGFEMVQFRQGVKSFNEPMKRFLGYVLDKRIVHDGNPILRWNACNISAKTDVNENIMPDKEHSSDKIDGMVSAIMAFGLCLADEASPGGSVYQNKELTFI